MAIGNGSMRDAPCTRSGLVSRRASPNSCGGSTPYNKALTDARISRSLSDD
jgi:hypothetical protein